MQYPVLKLESNQTFSFTCSPQVPCFNACCRDLNQVLTPYDVLQLKQYLEITSSDFLIQYTQESTGPGTGLPVVSLRFGDTHDMACPFVTQAGCRVYPARPGSCRTYPLARGVSRNRGTGILVEQWALIQEPHCQGHQAGRSQTVDDWVDDQQIASHNRMNDMMLELISLKNRFRPGPLRPSERKRVYTALYDLDAFRNDLLVESGVDGWMADSASLSQAKTDDLELLIIAMRWIRQKVFNVSPENTCP